VNNNYNFFVKIEVLLSTLMPQSLEPHILAGGLMLFNSINPRGKGAEELSIINRFIISQGGHITTFPPPGKTHDFNKCQMLIARVISVKYFVRNCTNLH